MRDSAAGRSFAAARLLRAGSATAPIEAARAADDERDPLLRLLSTPGPVPLVHAPRPRWERQYAAALLGVDVLAAIGGFLIATFIDVGASMGLTRLWVGLAWPVVFVAATAAARSYESRFWGSGPDEFRRVFDAGLCLLALVATLVVATGQDDARAFVVIGLPTTVGLCLAGRYGLRWLLVALRHRNLCQHDVVLVGRERSVAEFTHRVRSQPSCGLRIVGACIDNPRGSTVGDVPVLGTSATIDEAVARTGADTVALTSFTEMSQEDVRRLSWQLEHSRATLMVAPRLTDVSGPRLTVRPIAGVPMLNIEPPEFRGARRIMKGTFDRTAAALLIFLMLPALAAIALAIRLTSRGPALFRQQRVGLHGRHFTMYKFRTMCVDAEQRLAEVAALNEANGLLFKVRHDPRVTRLGRWLRRLSVDELPQLFNVVAGHMSLVGPRPPLATEVDGYEEDVYRRLLVKPGLTGLWQVSGRSDISWNEAVRLDLYYVENWSLLLDITILWKTLYAVVRARGAY